MIAALVLAGFFGGSYRAPVYSAPRVYQAPTISRPAAPPPVSVPKEEAPVEAPPPRVNPQPQVQPVAPKINTPPQANSVPPPSTNSNIPRSGAFNNSRPKSGGSFVYAPTVNHYYYGQSGMPWWQWFMFWEMFQGHNNQQVASANTTTYSTSDGTLWDLPVWMWILFFVILIAFVCALFVPRKT